MCVHECVYVLSARVCACVKRQLLSSAYGSSYSMQNLETKGAFILQAPTADVARAAAGGRGPSPVAPSTVSQAAPFCSSWTIVSEEMAEQALACGCANLALANCSKAAGIIVASPGVKQHREPPLSTTTALIVGNWKLNEACLHLCFGDRTGACGPTARDTIDQNAKTSAASPFSQASWRWPWGEGDTWALP